jgi:Mn-containing catalase
VDVAYNFDLLNFVAQELSTDKRAYEAFALLLNKDTRTVADYEKALQRIDEKDSSSVVGEQQTDFKPEITELLRIKDKHTDKWSSDSLMVIVMFAFK